MAPLGNSRRRATNRHEVLPTRGKSPRVFSDCFMGYPIVLSFVNFRTRHGFYKQRDLLTKWSIRLTYALIVAF